MSIGYLLLLALGVSMDAFAVAICKGLNMKTMNYKVSVLIGVFFGGFQALMPLIGWAVGLQFEHWIKPFDHWVILALLVLIGGKMVKEALSSWNTCELEDEMITLKELLFLSVATSLDALAVGITFALLPDINILFAVGVIGLFTMVLSFLGCTFGNKMGCMFKSKAELFGGIVLIAIGIRIMVQHMVDHGGLG